MDLLIIMLGTNDIEERLGVNAACISLGMERLVRKAQTVDCWGGKVRAACRLLCRLRPAGGEAGGAGVPAGEGLIVPS